MAEGFLKTPYRFPFARRVAEFSSVQRRCPQRGCWVMTGNYTVPLRRETSTAMGDSRRGSAQTGIHTSFGFTDPFTGRLDGAAGEWVQANPRDPRGGQWRVGRPGWVSGSLPPAERPMQLELSPRFFRRSGRRRRYHRRSSEQAGPQCRPPHSPVSSVAPGAPRPLARHCRPP
jgi:hypothetical protein